MLAVVALFMSGAGIRTLSGSRVLSRSSCRCFSLRFATRSSMSEYFDSRRDMTFWEFCVAALLSTAVPPAATTGVFSLSFNASSALLFLLYKNCLFCDKLQLNYKVKDIFVYFSGWLESPRKCPHQWLVISGTVESIKCRREPPRGGVWSHAIIGMMTRMIGFHCLLICFAFTAHQTINVIVIVVVLIKASTTALEICIN